MSAAHFEYEKKRSPLAQAGIALGVVALIGVGIMLVRQMTSGSKTPSRREQEMVMIKPTPPPPPPPPPPPQTVPKQQMDEQTQITEQDMKQAEEPPDTAPAMGTGVTGNGPPDGFGLGGRDRGMIGGSGGGGMGGSRFGGYFNQVIHAVTEALGRHATTRNASFDIRVRVWSDTTGRVTKVKLMQSTGTEELDRVLRSEALIGCQLPDRPDGMRMPIELRLNLHRPN